MQLPDCQTGRANLGHEVTAPSPRGLNAGAAFDIRLAAGASPSL